MTFEEFRLALEVAGVDITQVPHDGIRLATGPDHRPELVVTQYRQDAQGRLAFDRTKNLPLTEVVHLRILDLTLEATT